MWKYKKSEIQKYRDMKLHKYKIGKTRNYENENIEWWKQVNIKTEIYEDVKIWRYGYLNNMEEENM